MTQLAKYNQPTPRLKEIDSRLSARCGRQELAQTVRMILGRYNQKPQGDADLYVRQMTALLSEYPAEIVQAFAHPTTDPLPASDFLPSVATVRDTADGMLVEMYRVEDLYNRRRMPQLPEPDEGPADQERDEVGDKMRALVDGMKMTAKQREAQNLPEWMLDEADQSDVHKRVTERLRHSQCKSGEAIRSHLAKSDPIEDTPTTTKGK